MTAELVGRWACPAEDPQGNNLLKIDKDGLVWFQFDIEPQMKLVPGDDSTVFKLWSLKDGSLEVDEQLCDVQLRVSKKTDGDAEALPTLTLPGERVVETPQGSEEEGKLSAAGDLLQLCLPAYNDGAAETWTKIPAGEEASVVQRKIGGLERRHTKDNQIGSPKAIAEGKTRSQVLEQSLHFSLDAPAQNQ